MTAGRYNTPSPYVAGLRMRCPRCGEGPLFAGYLRIAEACTVCGLPLSKNDTGDGPAVFLIFIIGTVATAFVFLLDRWIPGLPYWIPVLSGSVLVIVMTLVMLRPSKAYVVALHYRHHREDYEDGRRHPSS